MGRFDDLLRDLNKLHDRWDAKGGYSGKDGYENALYDCINELADLIIFYEKKDSITLDKKPCSPICQRLSNREKVYLSECWTPLPEPTER